jgi:hypothetical protein
LSLSTLVRVLRTSRLYESKRHKVYPTNTRNLPLNVLQVDVVINPPLNARSPFRNNSVQVPSSCHSCSMSLILGTSAAFSSFAVRKSSTLLLELESLLSTTTALTDSLALLTSSESASAEEFWRLRLFRVVYEMKISQTHLRVTAELGHAYFIFHNGCHLLPECFDLDRLISDLLRQSVIRVNDHCVLLHDKFVGIEVLAAEGCDHFDGGRARRHFSFGCRCWCGRIGRLRSGLGYMKWKISVWLMPEGRRLSRLRVCGWHVVREWKKRKELKRQVRGRVGFMYEGSVPQIFRIQNSLVC